MAECHKIADMLVDAFKNPGVFWPFEQSLILIITVKVPWDAVRYADRITPKMTGRNREAELELRMRFKPVSHGEPLVLDKPATLVDSHGVILAWYMPNLISLRKQVSTLNFISQVDLMIDPASQEEIWKTCRHLDCTMPQTIKTKSGKGWRTDADLFRHPDSCHSSVPGLLDFSPAWFMQAHDVRRPHCSDCSLIDIHEVRSILP